MQVKNIFSKTSLSSQILFAVVGLIFLFGSLAAFFVYTVSTQNLIAISKKNQLNLTQDKSLDIKTIIDEVFSVSKQLSQEKIIIDAVSASDSSLLTKQATDKLNGYLVKDFYSTIYVMGKNGITLFSTDQSFVGQDYSFRPYFTEALQGRDFVDVGLGITTNKLGYYFSRPIYKDNKIIGVIVLKTFPSKIEKIVDYALLKDNAQTIITDDKGIVLYSSKAERLYKSMGDISTETAKLEQKYRFPKKSFLPLDYDDVQKEILTNKPAGSFEIYDKEDAEKEVLTFSKVGNYPFYFIIEAESAPYLTSAANSAIIISIFVLIAAIMAAFIIAIIVHKSLSPVVKLVKASEEIGKGNLTYEIPSFSSSELSQLAESFKKMAVNLQDLYKNIEVKVIERTKDLDERNKRISESELELKEALETSERANKLMVGRELEMLELKKVIKTLKEQKS